MEQDLLAIMNRMDFFRAIKSLWRFPRKDEPFSEATRYILALETQAEIQNTPTTSASEDNAVYLIKRRYPRYSLKGMHVHAHFFFSEEIELCNLSLNGACILSREKPRVADTYLLRIRNEKLSRALQCSVIWQRALKDSCSPRTAYTAGLQFHDLASDDIVMLKDYMRNSGTPISTKICDDFRPSPLRFCFTTGTKADLKCPRKLPIRTISIGGMAIESEHAPKIDGHYLMKLPLPHDSQPIKIKARIASVISGKDRRNAGFDIGVEFLAMEEPDKMRLQNFIQTL